jgi:XTP/dITP diphosphohydrolase
VINKDIGNEGFGYDGMFIPEKYDKTLGELNKDIKKSFSHRSKALLLAKIVLALFA